MMFDPTIYENLKVAFENQLYDLDNLDQVIQIIDRKDIIDLATMSREWTLSFILAEGNMEQNLSEGDQACSADIVLSSSIRDFADELLEVPNSTAACSVSLRFKLMVQYPHISCPLIEAIILNNWKRDVKPVQRLEAMYGESDGVKDITELWIPTYYSNTIELPFDRRITEEQMEDLPYFIECTVNTLEALGQAML